MQRSCGLDLKPIRSNPAGQIRQHGLPLVACKRHLVSKLNVDRECKIRVESTIRIREGGIDTESKGWWLEWSFIFTNRSHLKRHRSAGGFLPGWRGTRIRLR